MKRKPAILVVDDQKETLGLFRKILREQDYRVLTADNRKEALELVEGEQPNLAILNLTLAGINEIEILRRIKEIDENIEVMIITGYGTMETARKAMELGAYDYITKPFDNDYIIALIKGALSPVYEDIFQLELK